MEASKEDTEKGKGERKEEIHIVHAEEAQLDLIDDAEAEDIELTDESEVEKESSISPLESGHAQSAQSVREAAAGTFGHQPPDDGLQMINNPQPIADASTNTSQPPVPPVHAPGTLASQSAMPPHIKRVDVYTTEAEHSLRKHPRLRAYRVHKPSKLRTCYSVRDKEELERIRREAEEETEEEEEIKAAEETNAEDETEEAMVDHMDLDEEAQKSDM